MLFSRWTRPYSESWNIELYVCRLSGWCLIPSGKTSTAKEQLTSGHISPFNDGQGFFAQFDPSKVRDCDYPVDHVLGTMNWRYPVEMWINSVISWIVSIHWIHLQLSHLTCIWLMLGGVGRMPSSRLLGSLWHDGLPRRREVQARDIEKL